MPIRTFGSVTGVVLVLVAATRLLAGDALAESKKIKIGVVYDLTGPLAGGGSKLQYFGAKIVMDYFIRKGGVAGYQIEPVYSDAQSKPDIAVNETVRLIERERVDMVLGFFSSAQCMPVAALAEQLRKFMWITTCISTTVLENRNLKYVFRPQVSGRLYGAVATDFIANHAAKFGKEPNELRVAIVHEDGSYGVDVAKGTEIGARKHGFNIVSKEGYSLSSPDLSALVTKLKRARPDVIFHAGYNPDIALLLRQAREQGLRFGALVGQGAGYGIYDKLKESLGADANYLFNVDPVSIWLMKPEALDPALPPLIEMVGEEFARIQPEVANRSAHIGFSAATTYLFLSDVLPRAITKYGGTDSESLRRAALDTDLPEGATMLGFGVKFDPPGSTLAGQNMRAFPVVTQYIDGKPYVVWPKNQQQHAPMLPLPAGMTYSYK